METSPYETFSEYMGIQCSFGLKKSIQEIDIVNAWAKTNVDYPYLFDYQHYNDPITLEEAKTNSPLNVTMKDEITTVDDALDLMIRYNSIEFIKNRSFGQSNKSLLTYSTIELNHTTYSLFAIYLCHSKTDFKSIVFIAEAFINHFTTSPIDIKPIRSAYPALQQQHLIPSENEKESIELPVGDILKYDTTTFKDNIILNEKEQEQMKEETRELITNGIVSHTRKLTKEQTTKLKNYCKKNNLSVQALLLVCELQAYNTLFKKQNEATAKNISFMIPYDIRKYIDGVESDSIGLFSEGIYPTFAIDFLDKSINERATQLTTFLRNIKSLTAQEFKRFRYAIYNKDYPMMGIPYTTSLSNVAGFHVMDRISNEMKNCFVDMHLSGCTRIACTKQSVDLMIHTYSMYDGTSNLSLSYSYSVIPSIIPKRVLSEMIKLIDSL
ncbi:Condensation domain-containing protein [Entamoeba marina]